MGSPIDLTLGCSTRAPGNSDGSCYLSTNIDMQGGHLEPIRKAEEQLRSLEEERRKVDGFKRELPSCIQLLENAIRALKEQVANGREMPTLQLSCSSMDSALKERRNDAAESRPTLEEFLPVERSRRWSQQSDAEAEGSLIKPPPSRGTKRPAWMTEARDHLWTQNSTTSTEDCHEDEEEMEMETERGEREPSAQLLLASKEKSTKLFMPFLREHPDAATPSSVARPTPTMGRSGVGLSLSFGEPMSRSPNSSKGASDSEAGSVDVGIRTTPDAQQIRKADHVSVVYAGAGASGKVNNASKRKARRCWSPELHRRFISALHQLGGAEIATPKQICELMKVDGLTNDEVKSHLQKYRLHTRRSSPSPQPAAADQAQTSSPAQLVVLGSIWVPPPKYTLSASQPSPGVYDSSTGHPAQPAAQFYQATALPQGQYFACISNGTSGAHPVQIQHQPILEPPQAASQSQTSPQGSLKVASQLSEATQGPNSEMYRDESGEEEEEEEQKSDSTSWKNEDYQAGEELKKSSGSELATSDSVQAEA